MDKVIIYMLLCLSYYIGYQVRGFKDHEFICDCDKIMPLQIVNNINSKMLEDNINLKRDLHIAIDYINYTNLGNTYYDASKQYSGEESILYLQFIIDFYSMRENLYKSIMELIDSKRLLYKQYIELKKECFRY